MIITSDGYNLILVVKSYYNCEKMNSSAKLVEATMEDFDLTLAEKIVITVLWFVNETLGNVLLIGLIQFERLGGDPMKRRIVDQVLW